MKHWTEQANRNNLRIIDHGRCQLCGADTNGGLRECIEKAAFVTHLHEHELGIEAMTIFLSTDAHALSHGEIHGRWNNHFHLTRLYLILVKKIKWNYNLSPKLSQAVNQYKSGHLDEIISNPPSLERGLTTVTDVEKVSMTDYDQAIQIWAYDVFMAFQAYHHIGKAIADLFTQYFL